MLSADILRFSSLAYENALCIEHTKALDMSWCATRYYNVKFLLSFTFTIFVSEQFELSRYVQIWMVAISTVLSSMTNNLLANTCMCLWTMWLTCRISADSVHTNIHQPSNGKRRPDSVWFFIGIFLFCFAFCFDDQHKLEIFIVNCTVWHGHWIK